MGVGVIFGENSRAIINSCRMMVSIYFQLETRPIACAGVPRMRIAETLKRESGRAMARTEAAKAQR